MERKIILYLGGGAMSGVFGAGTTTKLQELDFYDNIEAIYATSVGTLNGAYFLTKQSKSGSTVYYEDLTHDFIFPSKIIFGFLKRFWFNFIHKPKTKEISDVININYAFNIIRNKKRLNIRKLKKQKIPLCAKLLNINTGKIEYFDIRKGNTLKILKAAVSIVPYWFSCEKINGQEYVDGSIKESIGLKYLLDKYPNHKIVIVLNFITEKNIKHYITNLLEAIAAEQFKESLFDFIENEEKLAEKDIDLAKKTKRVLLIHPKENDPDDTRTTDKKELLRIFEMGKKQALKIKEFI